MAAKAKAPSAAVESTFRSTVRRIIQKIPAGTTLSYGQVALLAGKPGAPRAVVQALQGLSDVPWWRVCRAKGFLAPQVAKEQARRLRTEGAVVKNNRVCGRAGLSKFPNCP